MNLKNMPNTYTQIHIHVVFAVQDRLSLITDTWRERLYKYIVTTIQGNGHKVLAIGGMPDHVHILFGMRPNESLSHLMQELKRDSSRWINENRFVRGNFSWQEGFGAFSYSKSQLPAVANYIANQQTHHAKCSFHDEYIKILHDFDIEYDERYIFKSIES
jgi:putative transposase